jgi:glucokinase
VLLGGGLSEAMGQPFADRVAASMKQHVFPTSLGKCRVLATRLADDAGLLGAALLAREKFGHRR